VYLARHTRHSDVAEIVRRRGFRALCAAATLILGACTQLGVGTLNLAAEFSSFSRHTDLVYGVSAADKLDVYIPNHPEHSPVMVFFYGGGWDSGDKSAYKFVVAAFSFLRRQRLPVLGDIRRFIATGAPLR
jgi:acetyl esterase/lipase